MDQPSSTVVTRGRALHGCPKKKRTSDGWEVQGTLALRLWATQSFHRWSIATARLVAFHRAQEHQKQHRARCVPFTEHCMPSTPFIERRQSCNGKAAVRTKYSTINADLGLDLDQLHHHLQDEHIKTTRYAQSGRNRPWCFCRFMQLCDIGPIDFFRSLYVDSTIQGDFGHVVRSSVGCLGSEIFGLCA